jgi:hypothetical protein
MNEQAVLRQISNYMDVGEVKKNLHIVHQMQDYLNALRSGELQVSKGWVNSQLIFPEDFAEEMNKLSSNLHSTEELLKQCDRLEEALKNQLEKLQKKTKL